MSRILTTHVGSLPRSQAVVDFLFAREHGKPYDERAFADCMTENVARTVAMQKQVGIDVVSDVETSKISYATYVKDRLSGFGGDILNIEVSLSEGSGKVLLTGSLGEVMQESAQAALTYARTNARGLGLDPNVFDKANMHIHIPAGATPKDGPSAGIALATAIISAFTRRPVRRDVAMTGEVTLRGKVLPIGGLKSKTIAAHRAGIKTVLLPKDNAKDIPELPERVRQDLELIPVGHLDDVIAVALLEPVEPPMKVGDIGPTVDAAVVPPVANGSAGERVGRVN